MFAFSFQVNSLKTVMTIRQNDKYTELLIPKRSTTKRAVQNIISSFLLKM